MQDNLPQLNQQVLPANSAGEVPDANDTELNLEVRFGYRLGSHNFILDQALLTEIVVHPVIYPIPKSPPWLNGVINLRGNIIPVFDLSASLGTVYQSNPGNFVLVIDKGRDALALIIDATPKSLINPKPLTSITETTSLNNEFIQAGVESDKTTWLQLDVKRLISSLQHTPVHEHHTK